MKIWDVATKTHDVMAHTGLLMPHAEAALRGQRRAQVAERDRPAADHPRRDHRRRLQAGAGRRDRPLRQPRQEPGRRRQPLGPRPELSRTTRCCSTTPTATRGPDDWEFHRPGRIPQFSEFEDDGTEHARSRRRPRPTTRARCDPDRAGGAVQADAARAVPRGHDARPGLLPHRRRRSTPRAGRGTNPPRRRGRPTDQRAAHRQGAVDGSARSATRCPFSAYLIGRLVNPTGYATQFNLDADRAYAYLTWDWIRGDERRQDRRHGLPVPKCRRGPAGWTSTTGWNGCPPMQLHYVDPPPSPVILAVRAGGPTRTERSAHRRATPEVRHDTQAAAVADITSARTSEQRLIGTGIGAGTRRYPDDGGHGRSRGARVVGGRRRVPRRGPDDRCRGAATCLRMP